MNKLTPQEIKYIRHKTGLSQSSFCELFGLNLNTYRHWEMGNREPNASSVILLNLISDAGYEVVRLMNKKENSTMINKVGKEYLKNFFYNHRNPTIYDFLNKKDEIVPDVLILLIEANGLPYYYYEINNDMVYFYAGHTPELIKEVLNFKLGTTTLNGDFSKLMEKTFLLVYALEEKLRDAVYWTPEMRENRISEIIDDIGVDKTFYININRNW